MRPVATDVACSVVCVSVCLPVCVGHTGELCKKRLIQSRCRLGSWLMGGRGTMYSLVVQVCPWQEGDLLAHCRIPAHCLPAATGECACLPSARGRQIDSLPWEWQDGDGRLLWTLCYYDISDVSMFVFCCTQFKTLFVVFFIAAVLPLILLKFFRVHFHGELSMLFFCVWWLTALSILSP